MSAMVRAMIVFALMFTAMPTAMAETGRPPSIDVSLSPSGPDGDGGWYISPVTFTLASDDPYATFDWFLEGAGGYWVPWVGPVTLHGNRRYEFHARAHGAGGTSEVLTATFDLDATAPVTSATLHGPANGAVYTGEVEVTLEVFERWSGVAATHVRIGGGAEQVYEGPIIVEDDGLHRVEFRSVDVAGNVEDWRDVVFEIARPPPPEPPPITIEQIPSAPDGSGGWWVSPVTVAITSSDPDAALAWRSAPDTRWHDGSAPILFEDDGIFEVEARASGVGGDTHGAVSLRLDCVPPVSDVDLLGVQDDAGAYLNEVILRVNAWDATSGVDATWFRLGGESQERYTAPVVITDSGVHTVAYRSTDNAGNEEVWQEVTLEIVDQEDDEGGGLDEEGPGDHDEGGEPDDGVDPHDEGDDDRAGDGGGDGDGRVLLPICSREQGLTSFHDTRGSGHGFFIDCLARLGIVRGKTDGQFHPTRAVTRGQLASFIARAVQLATKDVPSPVRSPFPDVATGSAHAAAIARLHADGIIQGFSDGTFRPAQPVSRDQAARYVVRALESMVAAPLPHAGHRFVDVVTDQYVEDIDKLVTVGIVAGFPDGRFGPRQSVTRGRWRVSLGMRSRSLSVTASVSEACSARAGGCSWCDLS